MTPPAPSPPATQRHFGAARVAVIVPHYQQLEFLGACLDSLAAQSLPRDRFDVWVVDNASPCGREAVAAVVGSRAQLVIETEKGAGPARNCGVSQSQGEVIAFLDADCIAHPWWLEEGLRGLGHYDLVGGRVDVSVTDEAAMTGSEAFERVFAFDVETYIRKKDFTISGNLFTTRAVFDRVGGFRNGVSEDMDWCRRAVAMGYELGYHDAASIAHPARVTWAELTRKWRRMNRESMLLFQDRPLGTSLWMARNYLLPLSIFPAAIKMVRSRKLPDGATRLRGLATLIRLRLWRFADAHRALLEKFS